MKHLILAAATLLLIQGADARERRGPPSACPEPKVDCCPKPCKPKCEPKPCKPVCKPVCAPKPSCDPCCPPVCFERGEQSDPCCIPSAYSERAAYEFECGWDTFITASFIYWEAQQGGMELAIPGQGTVSGNALTVPFASATGKHILKTNFEYKPGFKVGLGWAGGKDNWVLYAQYTWLHGTTNTSSGAAPAPGVASINGVALPQTGIWYPTSFLTNSYTNYIASRISSTWNYRIDLVDAQVSRPFYSGTRFTLEPFFGLRGGWIRQTLTYSTTNYSVGGVNVPFTPAKATYRSRSSAVGPRAGLNGKWFLGWGFRVEGNSSVSALFTDYDLQLEETNPDASGASSFPTRLKLDDLHLLRPNLELSIGLGWGSYFGCRRFHWDLAARYDFNVFWGQNMLRYIADMAAQTTCAQPADLYLQGLTIETRFDF